MSTPWFFLSYASISPEHDARVARFYSDLVGELRATAGLDENNVPAADIGFFAQTGSTAGDIWTDKLIAKLCSCRVLICLYSDKYFRSVACGKEFAVFNSRVDAYVRGHPGATRHGLTVPALWVIPKGFPDSRPAALLDIDYKCDHLDKIREARGLYYMQGLEKYRDEYEGFVSWLARFIYEVADPPILSPLAEVEEYKKVRSAFHKRPAAPGQLTARAVSAHEVDLSWAAGAGDREGFVIERRRASDGPDGYSEVSSVGARATSFRDEGLAPGTRYVYRVRSFIGGWDSAYSETAEALTREAATRGTRGEPGGPEKAGGISRTQWWRGRRILNVTLGAVLLAVLIPLGTAVWKSVRDGGKGTKTNANDNGNASVTPPPSPPPAAPRPAYVYPNDLLRTDLFLPNPGTVCRNSRGWEGMGKWDVRNQTWKVQAGSDGDTSDCALVLSGESPGFFKDSAFDNFKAIFDITFIKGEAAGWYLRAVDDGRGGYYGYKFIWRRPPPESQTFWLIASVRDADGEKELQKCSVSIPGLTHDGRVGIDVRAEGGKFDYVFTLQPRHSTDQSQILRQAPTTPTCSVTAKSGFVPAGRLGFFAGDGTTTFSIDQVDINGARSAPPD